MLALDVMNALIFMIWQVNVDTAISYYITYDETSVVGGMMYKFVMFIFYFWFTRLYKEYANEKKTKTESLDYSPQKGRRPIETTEAEDYAISISMMFRNCFKRIKNGLFKCLKRNKIEDESK